MVILVGDRMSRTWRTARPLWYAATWLRDGGDRREAGADRASWSPLASLRDPCGTLDRCAAAIQGRLSDGWLGRSVAHHSP